MSNPIIKGDSSVHDHFTGGRRESAGVEETVTFVRQGLYADLKAEMPLRGEKYRGFLVVSSELSPARGGMGMLTIKCLVARVTDVQFEVDTAQLEKPLLSHPKFADVADEVEAWRNAASEMRKRFHYLDESGTEVSLSTTGILAAALILKGVESYLEFTPVARRITTKTGFKPNDVWSDVGEECGRRKSPPSALRGMIGGKWKWLKTADRATATSAGSGVRTEEWTASEKWNDLLYED